MKHSLRIRSAARSEVLEAAEGLSLSEALRAMGPLGLESPCGGKGLCGKCRIGLVGGALSAPDETESRLLSAAEIASGIRLACRARILGDAEVELFERGEASIVAAGPDAVYALDPSARLVTVAMRESGLEDQLSDEARLLAALSPALPRGRSPSRVALSALPGLALSARGGEVEALIAGDEVLSVSPRRGRGGRALGVGVDIGTTTVLCRLLDLNAGRSLGARSEINAQAGYGADVLSRIAASEEPGGLEALRDPIRSQLRRMIAELAADAGGGASVEDVLSIAVAGNTTMLHFLAGVPPGAMARSPFTPAFLGCRRESAAALALVAHSGCVAHLLPGVSAYVGADIVAGMAAIRLHEARGRSLYLDLGTNGELALGGKDGILCCATAAGPAFEGAGIEKGMGGFEGAIDSVWIEDGKARFGTIGGGPAKGICGSGLIDALAAFLDLGMVDETGRVDEAVGERMYLDQERGIYLSQADVRAAQLAKAAIAAGIDTLLGAAGCGLDEVERLYLAGGFGSLLDLRGAVRVGLLPAELSDRVLVVGNASGAGAAAACLSASALEACSRVASLCEYLELSGRSDFNAAYIDRMIFPERA
jgi:uncharacterized 2Fe-2S/4Fe-4S cluster protein (DUF4445 family)